MSNNDPQEKKLRRAFAQRLRDLIASEPGPQRLLNFSIRSGIAIAKLSEWQSTERDEWPSMRNFIRLCVTTERSADYLLFGRKEPVRRRTDNALQRILDRVIEKEKLSGQDIEAFMELTKEAMLRYDKVKENATDGRKQAAIRRHR